MRTPIYAQQFTSVCYSSRPCDRVVKVEAVQDGELDEYQLVVSGRGGIADIEPLDAETAAAVAAVPDMVLIMRDIRENPALPAWLTERATKILQTIPGQ